MARQIGITDEPEVRLEAERRERLRQPLDASRETSGTRVLVGSFERHDVKLHVEPPDNRPLPAARASILGRMSAGYARLADHRQHVADLSHRDLPLLLPVLSLRFTRQVGQGEQAEELVGFVDNR